MRALRVACALPDYITREYPELVNVLPGDTSPAFTIFFAYPEELKRSQRVQAFRDFMLREIAEFNRLGAASAARVAHIA